MLGIVKRQEKLMGFSVRITSRRAFVNVFGVKNYCWKLADMTAPFWNFRLVRANLLGNMLKLTLIFALCTTASATGKFVISSVHWSNCCEASNAVTPGNSMEVISIFPCGRNDVDSGILYVVPFTRYASLATNKSFWDNTDEESVRKTEQFTAPSNFTLLNRIRISPANVSKGSFVGSNDAIFSSIFAASSSLLEFNTLSCATAIELVCSVRSVTASFVSKSLFSVLNCFISESEISSKWLPNPKIPPSARSSPATPRITRISKNLLKCFRRFDGGFSPFGGWWSNRNSPIKPATSISPNTSNASSEQSSQITVPDLDNEKIPISKFTIIGMAGFVIQSIGLSFLMLRKYSKKRIISNEKSHTKTLDSNQ